MTATEITAIGASIAVVVLQGFKYDNNKNKDRVVRISTGIFACIVIFATAWTTSRSQSEAAIKEAKSEAKQIAEVVKLDSNYRANLHLRDSATASYLRTIITRDQLTREEMKRVFDENQRRLDYQYANNISHQSELFNLISRRTFEEFIAEKTPKDMSFDQAKKIVSQAVHSYVLDSITEWKSNKMIRDSSGMWREPEDGRKLYVNYQTRSNRSMIYWDAFLDENDGPPQSYFINVIIDNNSYTSFSGAEKIDLRIVNLYHQYRSWFDQIRPSGQMGNYRPEHDIIFIVNDDNKFTSESLYESLNFTMSFSLTNYILRGDSNCKIIIYRKSELQRTNTFLF